MHIAQYKTMNQVLDYLLALILSLIIHTVNNNRLDSCVWRSDILIHQKKSLAGSPASHYATLLT